MTTPLVDCTDRGEAFRQEQLRRALARGVKWVPALGSGLPPDGDIIPITGDLGCQGVDVDNFELHCRVPVAEGWNVWLMNRTLTDGSGLSDMARGLETFMSWRPGKVDSIKVISLWGEQVNVFKQHLDEKKKAELMQGLVKVRSRSQLPELVTLAPGPSTQFLVSFVYRSGLDTMSWPVGPGRCPREATYTLEAAYRFSKPPPVPPEPKLLPSLPDVSKIIDDAAEKLRPGIGTTLALTVVGGLVVAYVVRSFK